MLEPVLHLLSLAPAWRLRSLGASQVSRTFGLPQLLG